MACLSWQAKGENLISSKIEQCGALKDALSPILGNDPVKVFLNDSKMRGEWSLEMLDKWGTYKIIPGIQSFDGYCIIDPEILKICYRDKIVTEYDELLNRDLFPLRLSFTEDSGATESVILKWGLLPTRPIVSVLEFTYVYDWEWDDIWPNGNFCFKVEYNDAERVEYNVTQSFQFGSPSFFNYCYVIDSPSPAIINYDADWGEFIQISTWNKYGWANSDIICTTDYITDPDILNRINEIASVTDLEEDAEDPLISKENDTLAFKEPVDVNVYDIAGKQALSLMNVDSVSLSFLNPGIYVINYRLSNKSFTLKYYKK